MSHKIFIEDDNDLKESFEKFKENKKIDFKNEIFFENNKLSIKRKSKIKLSFILSLVIICISFIMIIHIKNIEFNKEEKEFKQDIKNVISISSNMESGDVGMDSSFAHTLNCVNNNSKYQFTYYSIEINFDNSYILCGYKPNKKVIFISKEKGTDGFYDDVVWVKYETEDVIFEEIDGMYICDFYYVYDILIKEDLIYNKKYNKVLKYYCNAGDWLYNEICYRLKKEMILFYYKDYDLFYNQYSYINQFLTNYDFCMAYELYLDNNYNIYFSIISKIVYLEDNNREKDSLNIEFGEKYSLYYFDLLNVYKKVESLYELSYQIVKNYDFSKRTKEKIYLEKVIVSLNDVNEILNIR